MSNSISPIRMVALDLDGTVLNHQGQVTSKTAAAITRAIEKGVIVLPATGRPLSGLPAALCNLSGVRYAVTTNGAAVWDMGDDPMAAVHSRYANTAPYHIAQPTCLLHRTLPPSLAKQSYDILRQFEGDLILFRDGMTIKSEKGMAWSIAHAKRLLSTEAREQQKNRFLLVPDLTEWLRGKEGEIEKFCMFFADMRDVERAKTLFSSLSGITLVQGSPDNVEITAEGVDKGEALLELGKRFGLGRENILAVGDSDNDLAMLQKVGVAAVMANGIPSVRAIAQVVSQHDCNHDGVAELLERLVL